MKKLFVCALSLFPLGVLQGQEANPLLNSGLVAGLFTTESAQLAPEFGPAPTANAARFSLRPVLFGAVIGAAVGAAIGHEVGAPRSCPTSPNYSCGKPAFGTLGGAALGMALGATVGAVVGMRQRDGLRAKFAPLVNVRDPGVGLSYSRRF